MIRIRYADLPTGVRSALLDLMSLIDRNGIDIDLVADRLRNALRAIKTMQRAAKAPETPPGEYEKRARAVSLRFECARDAACR